MRDVCHNCGTTLMVRHESDFEPPSAEGGSIFVVSTTCAIPAQQQITAIEAYAATFQISCRDPIIGPSGRTLDALDDYLERSVAKAVFIYRIDCLGATSETRSIGEFFRERHLQLRAVSEEICFTGGYRDSDPVVTVRMQKTSFDERIARIGELRSFFTSLVHGSDGQGVKCGNPSCRAPISVYDHFQGGGGVDYYRPLKCCEKCGWYHFDGEYWTTDY